MAYLGDPREGRIGPNGELWEMDNRVEKRYYWNGAYLDLCNMDPKEATNRVVNVRVVDGDISVKTTNKITLSLDTVSGNIYQLKAVSEKPVESDIVIICDYTTTDSDGKTITGKTTIRMEKGATEGTVEITGVGTVKTITVDTKVGSSEENATEKSYSDDKYKYTVSDLNDNTQNLISLYYGIYPYKNDLNRITVADLQNKLEQESFEDTQVNFVIPGIDKELDTPEELEEYAYRLVIGVSVDYASKTKIIDDASEGDATDDFPKELEINDGGVKLALLVRTNATGELSPLKNEDLKIGYKVTISE